MTLDPLTQRLNGTERKPTAVETAIDTALEAVRRARVVTCTPDTPQAAHEAVLDAIAALECGLDVLADLAAMGTSTAVAEAPRPACDPHIITSFLSGETVCEQCGQVWQ
ncbi:hypothetical protein [Nocardioides sp.]|uniref:hypothetical protein n=1 Tax=Nocardioides sp. TaxID=35761 RepID=UPI002D198681|nr:hypothetical protein [Nocardioides sp.]HSX67049.1 hypothetical protein [Nocardioides sp.]